MAQQSRPVFHFLGIR